ncbi:OLC1v1039224C2 [Oldenlandia corymbosa var. corymbosa]|nr:OLC1v1039224C2 [Oldenlandia corymbosa var. corymbosa]
MKNFSSKSFLLMILLFLTILSSGAELKTCKPNGRVKARKTPPGFCSNNPDCCIEGHYYPTYQCSPPVSQKTRAILTLSSFENEIYGPTSCSERYYSDEMHVVALSTGWYNRGARCLNNITITAPNGKSVNAIVVDECDSTVGCDEDDDFQPPCANNVVEASKGVWKALGVPQEEWAKLPITWSPL